MGWLALVWLVFLASALKPLGRDELWIDLVRTVSPARADRLAREQFVRLVQTAPGPVYGKAGWTGRRSLGGHGRSGSLGLTHLELMFGDPLEGPQLRVNTVWNREGRSDRQPDDLRRELIRKVWHRQVQPPEGLTPEELRQWGIDRWAEIDQRPVPEWTPVEFSIDGVACRGQVAAEGDDWVGLIDQDVALIGLQSHQIPTDRVALVRVQDLTPFLDESTPS